MSMVHNVSHVNSVSNAPSNLTQNAVDLFSYHVVHGNFSNQSTTYPNTTVGRTFLNDTTWVSLEGNKSQVVAWAIRSDGKVHVLNQGCVISPAYSQSLASHLDLQERLYRH